MVDLKISPPMDLISISLANILTYRKDEEFYNLVKDWNKTVVINVKEFYPVVVKFQGDEINFEMADLKDADLKVTMGIHSMMDLAFGRLGVVKAVLTRKLKIKGMLKIGTLLKFQKIFLNTMKMVAAEPNLNYFELEKRTR